MSTLSDNSVLMRFTAGLPGQNRQDAGVTAQVTEERQLEAKSGHWTKKRFPKDALKAIKTLRGKARAYHDKVTLPFGCPKDEAGKPSPDGAYKKTPAIAGVGILPAALIQEYGDTMRGYCGKMEVLVAEFINKGSEWCEWARKAHNGTFEPENYPGCSLDSNGTVVLDFDVWKEEVQSSFYLLTEPLPVPHSEQFSAKVAVLLGNDAQLVNLRVADAEVEARKELMRRLIEPVQAMAKKLAEKPKLAKDGTPKEDIVFRNSLVGNVKEIVRLARKLNVTGDPQIEAFIGEVGCLTLYAPNTLRKDKAVRDEAQKRAEETLKRLSGYKLG
jgi:hypothetical protein